MNIVSLYQVRKAYGDRVVLDGVTLGIDAHDKIGLVGRNGSGKSTLFRILVGEEPPDDGTVARHGELTVGYLPQEPPLTPGHTVWQVVADGMRSLMDARAEADVITHALEVEPDDEALLDRYEAIQAEIERLGGWNVDHRIHEMLQHLGVDDIAQSSVDHLSGGQRKRVALARVLLMRPSLLILDEPTNHLDADTVDWLEEMLRDSDSAVALITHDRYFLDHVVNRMVELEGGVTRSYVGNYSTFLAKKAERMLIERKSEARRLKLVEQELAWLSRTPAARRGKQKARSKRAESLAEKGGARREIAIPLNFQPSQKIRGDTILNAMDLEMGFGDRGLFRDFTIRMVRGDRVGIIGPNGCGKTTLLRVLLKQLAPRAGVIEHGKTTRIGYFDQERAGISPEATLVEAVAPNGDHVNVGGERIHVRRYLEDFLFPVGEQARRIESLSGGERNRILLARLMAEGANLLVLDEPTNDLDLDTLQVLEDALARFNGCLLVVTHDRYFLNRIANRILAFIEGPTGESEVRAYAGDYDIYKTLRARELQAEKSARQPPVSAAVAPKRPARERAGLSWKEERELETVEKEIPELEARRERVEARLADPGSFAADADKLSRLGQLHRELDTALEARYERWTELMEKKEDAE